MEKKKIAALTIGQTPRPDLADPLRARMPAWEIVEIGALDHLTDQPFESAVGVRYPLSTRLRSGQQIFVTESEISSYFHEHFETADLTHFSAGILLCAGTFADLHVPELPLIKPFEVGRAMLQAIIATNIGIVAPFAAQEDPIRERWLAAGFQPLVWTQSLEPVDPEVEAELNEKIAANQLRALVLDYVGHPPEAVAAFQRICSVPVIDLGSAAIDMLVARLT